MIARLPRLADTRWQSYVVVLLLASSCLLPSNVRAQTCMSPIVVQSGQTDYSGDTCLAGNELSGFCRDSVVSPSPDVVYYLGAEQPISGSISIMASYDAIVVVQTDSCSSSAPCVGVGNSSTPIQITPDMQGPFWVIVSGDPSGGATLCGSYTLSFENFQVQDDIFSNGFENLGRSEAQVHTAASGSRRCPGRGALISPSRSMDTSRSGFRAN